MCFVFEIFVKEVAVENPYPLFSITVILCSSDSLFPDNFLCSVDFIEFFIVDDKEIVGG